ncbi:MAG: hypothetical protein KA354_11535 [Phycisphaerae bacterium]|nr:hypothetical protein [Phycisphaerae bacterium]
MTERLAGAVVLAAEVFATRPNLAAQMLLWPGVCVTAKVSNFFWEQDF